MGFQGEEVVGVVVGFHVNVFYVKGGETVGGGAHVVIPTGGGAAVGALRFDN